MTIKTLTKLAVNSRVQALAIFLLLLLPFFIASFVVLSGSLPFWYDPARDFLLAWDNLSKVTLIGPVTGIPGIFYGPYWIWLISMGLLISKDPKITVFLIQTIPYILILPGIFLLQKNFSRLSLASVWLLFMFGTGIHYATMPWNPHIAPIFLIFIFLLIAHINLSALHQREYRSAVLLGVLLGLVVNVHISFGVVAVLGTAIYLLTSFMTIDRKKRKKFTSELFWSQALFCLLTTLGLLVTFTPFFLFEIRHNFIQTKSLLATLTANHPVVGLKGLSHQEIIRQFFLSATQFVGVG
ncbi:MAG TPA: hypothetical protein VG935_04025, partial [Patescibacteria group bacterium]|nr:hypothetical protein [Patescibacteria group bacterium]